MRWTVLLVLTALVGVSAGGWPLRRSPRNSKPAQDDLFERAARERLSTYETALQMQHRKLQELREQNAELERILAYVVKVFILSIVWPRVVRLFSSGYKRSKRHSQLKRTTFKDVAGSLEAKRELQEIVEFLKHPKKFKQVGARVPKGVLMEGGPGVGKTLLARAVAGEAGVSFIDTSGSALGSTVYVGIGAGRVKALFAEARRKRPCIVFIDEIDALGGRRDAFSSNAESARTLNQLLTEMDGFEGDTGVVVIAATNRADVLDPALLRAGRFDRRVPIESPNVEERVEILRVHARGKKLAPEVNLEALARRTIGFSGAELATLLNEAAIGTACRNSHVISLADVDAAFEKQQVGLRRPSHMTPRVRATIAAHEAGHACMALLTRWDRVSRVTILPRSNGVGGFTAFAHDHAEEGLPTRERLLQELQVDFGGRVAEELAFGKAQVTVGASQDLRSARELAYRMVTNYGFGDDGLGLTQMGSNANGRVLVPEEVGKRVSRAVDKLLRTSYAECRRTMRAHWRLVQAMQTALLEKESLSEAEVDALLATYRKEAAMWPWQRAWARLPSLLPSFAALPAAEEPSPDAVAAKAPA